LLIFQKLLKLTRKIWHCNFHCKSPSYPHKPEWKNSLIGSLVHLWHITGQNYHSQTVHQFIKSYTVANTFSKYSQLTDVNEVISVFMCKFTIEIQNKQPLG